MLVYLICLLIALNWYNYSSSLKERTREKFHFWQGGEEFLFKNKLYYRIEYCDVLRVQIIKIYHAWKIAKEISPSLEKQQKREKKLLWGLEI